MNAISPLTAPRLWENLGGRWLRLVPLCQQKAGTGKILPHTGGDRLHIYWSNKLATLLGTGEGAESGSTEAFGQHRRPRRRTATLQRRQGIGSDPKGVPDHPLRQANQGGQAESSNILRAIRFRQPVTPSPASRCTADVGALLEISPSRVSLSSRRSMSCSHAPSQSTMSPSTTTLKDKRDCF